MRFYDKQVPTVNHQITELIQVTMLQVGAYCELRSVVDQAEQHKTHTGYDLTNNQYCNFYCQLRLRMAKALSSNTLQRQHTLYTNMTLRKLFKLSTDNSKLDPFAIGTPIKVIQAFSTNFKGTKKLIDQKLRTPLDHWKL